MQISGTGHITLRVYNVDSTVHVLCDSYGFNFHCFAGSHIGQWDEHQCRDGHVADVYSVIED